MFRGKTSLLFAWALHCLTGTIDLVHTLDHVRAESSLIRESCSNNWSCSSVFFSAPCILLDVPTTSELDLKHCSGTSLAFNQEQHAIKELPPPPPPHCLFALLPFWLVPDWGDFALVSRDFQMICNTNESCNIVLKYMSENGICVSFGSSS